MGDGRTCVDCGNFGSYGWEATCMRRIPISRDIVTGDTTRAARRDPWWERTRGWFLDRRGPEGKYFTPNQQKE